MSLQQSILEAEKVVRKYLRLTPAEHSRLLSQQSGAEVYLKLENFQVTGSFKARGAIHKLSTLGEEAIAAGIITASSGNHGLGVASGARKLGIKATVYVPEYADQSKVQAIELEGAEVNFVGDDCAITETVARKDAIQANKVYISPYNDLNVIAGQGTIAVELLQQLESIDAVFVAVGGGGLISGIGAYLKAVSPQTEIIACSPSRSPAMHECMNAKKIIDVPCYPTLSDATAGGIEEGAITLELCLEVVDRSILVDEEEIKAAMLLMMDQHHVLVEGAAGVAVAAFLKEQKNYHGKQVAILICGGNIGTEKLREVLS
ncbi:MAG: threonine/serine dehydratase [Gammaproteobacteria bacterium]|nr:threonine/serine dehydratase [Gammaproteobacteria bacterium]MDD9894577.1 threonine/serine dehydratase [Gammaproteobacteria bacterium]MDD9957825.1 threonine/serine dehydratase [Gammaproteobacteria bacterium]